MKNKALKTAAVAALIMFPAAFKINASTVTLIEAAGTVELYVSTGTPLGSGTSLQVSTTYISPSTSLAVSNYTAVRFGTFINNFVPTLGNSADWFSNFTGSNGYLGTKDGTLPGKLSSTITGGDANAITNYVLGNSGVSTGTATATLAVGSQLYAIFWNAPYVSNTGGVGNTFYPLTISNGAQAAILTNPGWVMPATSGLSDLATNYTLSDGTTAVLGTLDLATKGITLIPEPSSASLLALGLAGLVALRARRKS